MVLQFRSDSKKFIQTIISNSDFSINTIIVILLIFSIISINIINATATTESFNLTNTAMVRVDFPTTNYGTSTDISTQGTNSLRYGYLEIPSTTLDSVSNVTLYVYVFSAQTPYNLEFFETSSFDESTLTYNTRPAYGDRCTTPIITYTTGYRSIDITNCTLPYLMAWSNTSNGMYNFRSDDYAQTPYVVYNGDYINFTISTDKVNYTSSESIIVSYTADSTANIYIYRDNNGTYEMYDYYESVSGSGNLTFPQHGTWNTINGSYSARIYEKQWTDLYNYELVLQDTSNFYINSSYIPPVDLPPFPNATYPIPSFTPPVINNNTDENLTNNSVNNTWTTAYYLYVDNFYSSVNNNVVGSFNFTLYPIIWATNATNTVTSGVNSLNNTVSNNILAIIIPPIFNSFPNKVKVLITLHLLFVNILIILQSGGHK